MQGFISSLHLCYTPAMEHVIIRVPRQDEYPSVAEVINSEQAQWAAVLTPDEMRVLGIGQETAETLSEGANSRDYLIAEKENEILGFISWYLRTSSIAMVSMLQVQPEYQHQGIGSRLLAAVETAAEQAGAHSIALETQKKATWAMHFYNQNGYHILTDDDLKYEPHYQDILARPLAEDQPYCLLVKRLNNGGSAGGLLVREEHGTKQVLLVAATDNTWVLPKGHIDRGETPEQAAVREVLEETGFVAEILDYLGEIVRGTRKANGSIKDVRTIKIFRMNILGTDDTVIPEETFAWVPYDEALPLMRYDEDRAFLQQQAALFT